MQLIHNTVLILAPDGRLVEPKRYSTPHTRAGILPCWLQFSGPASVWTQEDWPTEEGALSSVCQGPYWKVVEPRRADWCCCYQHPGDCSTLKPLCADFIEDVYSMRFFLSHLATNKTVKVVIPVTVKSKQEASYIMSHFFLHWKLPRSFIILILITYYNNLKCNVLLILSTKAPSGKVVFFVFF